MLSVYREVRAEKAQEQRRLARLNTGEPLCPYNESADCLGAAGVRMQHFDDPEDRPLVCCVHADCLLASGDYHYAKRSAVRCRPCNGTGLVYLKHSAAECAECDGTGRA